MKKKYITPAIQMHSVSTRTHLLDYSVNNFRERDRRRVGDEED